MRVTADSNIYISALMLGGKPFQFLDLATQGDIQLFISEPIITEVLRVLGEKFGRDEAVLRRAEVFLRRVVEVVVPTQTLEVVKLDEPDNRILECAIEAKSDTIVTGDLDLPRLKDFRGVTIMRVADFLRMMQKGQQR